MIVCVCVHDYMHVCVYVRTCVCFAGACTKIYTSVYSFHVVNAKHESYVSVVENILFPQGLKKCLGTNAV